MSTSRKEKSPLSQTADFEPAVTRVLEEKVRQEEEKQEAAEKKKLKQSDDKLEKDKEEVASFKRVLSLEEENTPLEKKNVFEPDDDLTLALGAEDAFELEEDLTLTLGREDAFELGEDLTLTLTAADALDSSRKNDSLDLLLNDAKSLPSGNDDVVLLKVSKSESEVLLLSGKKEVLASSSSEGTLDFSASSKGVFLKNPILEADETEAGVSKPKDERATFQKEVTKKVKSVPVAEIKNAANSSTQELTLNDIIADPAFSSEAKKILGISSKPSKKNSEMPSSELKTTSISTDELPDLEMPELSTGLTESIDESDFPLGEATSKKKLPPKPPEHLLSKKEKLEGKPSAPFGLEEKAFSSPAQAPVSKKEGDAFSQFDQDFNFEESSSSFFESYDSEQEEVGSKKKSQASRGLLAGIFLSGLILGGLLGFWGRGFGLEPQKLTNQNQSAQAQQTGLKKRMGKAPATKHKKNSSSLSINVPRSVVPKAFVKRSQKDKKAAGVVARGKAEDREKMTNARVAAKRAIEQLKANVRQNETKKPIEPLEAKKAKGNPVLARKLRKKGVQFSMGNRLKKAESFLLQSLEADQKQAATHRVLGMVYFRQKKKKLARKHFQQFLKLAPDDPTAGLIRNLEKQLGK